MLARPLPFRALPGSTPRTPALLDELDARFRTGGDVPDPDQCNALIHLARLGSRPPGRPVGAGGTPGLFMWGGVGRGKTRLMDTLGQALGPAQVRRLHVAELLAAVHRSAVGGGDWAQRMDTLLGSARMLLLDEFHAYDGADALILLRVFESALARGMGCVLTANHPPAALWPDLPHLRQQARHYLPLAAWVEEHCSVLRVDGGRDYRERLAADAPPRWWPDAPATLPASSPGGWREVDFDGLFRQARGPADYTHLAAARPGLLIRGFPKLAGEHMDSLRRLVWFLDAAWEARQPLAITARASVEESFSGLAPELAALLGKDLARSRSRLLALCRI